MQNPALTLSVRNAIMLALGLTASSVVAAGGCAARESHELCANSEVDYATCTIPADTDIAAPGPDDPRTHVEVVCFDGSDGCDPCDAERITGAAIEQADNRCTIIDLQRVTLTCGPDPEASDCCYKVQLQGDLSCSVEGRPLCIGTDRTPRVAALRTGTTWPAGTQAFAEIRRPQDPTLIERLRNRWLASARYEHASVAAFARVGLQLLWLGAPAELLRATQQAVADEVRHAQLCFGLAAAYGGAPPCEAGPLRIDGCVSTGMDLEAALHEAIIDGALGEGAAALEALEGARACVDPVVRGVLSRIAEDEQRHALLAHQTVKWALDAEPRRAREVVRECLRVGQRFAPKPAAELGVDDDDAVRGYGLLSSNRRAWLRHEVWHEVVAPILSAMLQAPSVGESCGRTSHRANASAGVC
jgi:hypothetical protein